MEPDGFEGVEPQDEYEVHVPLGLGGEEDAGLEVSWDTTGDGRADFVEVDTSGDGRFDAARIDTTRDGRSDHVGVDSSGDRVYDHVVVDEDRTPLEATADEEPAPRVADDEPVATSTPTVPSTAPDAPAVGIDVTEPPTTEPVVVSNPFPNPPTASDTGTAVSSQAAAGPGVAPLRQPAPPAISHWHQRALDSGLPRGIPGITGPESVSLDPSGWTEDDWAVYRRTGQGLGNQIMNNSIYDPIGRLFDSLNPTPPLLRP